MENEYYKRYEPFFGEWRIKRFIGAGSYGRVFEIERRDEFDTVYTGALKAVTIPASQGELDEILADGMDMNGASTYFRDYVKELNREIVLMSKLKGHSNIVSYEDHKMFPHEDGVGWDILIRMELLTPITSYLKENHTFPRREVIQLGMDLCKALEICQRYNIIHRDIKPANIFISETEDFKLGDFGVARIASASTGASTRAGTVNYMAPEVFRGEKYTSNVDIYSLGLVMYQLLNNNRMPLYPPYPQPITPSSRERAQAQRLSGAALPPPANAEGRLAEIVLKACAPDPAQRYDSPTVMRQALEAIQYSEGEAGVIYPDGDAIPVPGTTTEEKPSADGTATENIWTKLQPKETETSPAEETIPVEQPVSAALDDSDDDTERVPAPAPAAPESVPEQQPAAPEERKTVAAPAAPQKKGGKLPLVIGGVAVAAVVAVGGFALAGRGGASGTEAASAAEAIYTAGTYTAMAEGCLSNVTVTVTVSDTAITDVRVDASGETAELGGKAAEELPSEIIRSQSTDVDGYTGATLTSDAIKQAAADCIAQASTGKAASSSAASAAASSSAASAAASSSAASAAASSLSQKDADPIDSGTCGNYATWEFYRDGTLYIKGSGAMSDFPTSSGAPWYASHGSDIRKVIIEDRITRIGNSAFAACSAMHSVSIPDSVTEIGTDAFFNCNALKSVTIPNGVTKIGEYAFSYCSALKSVTIPDNVTEIGEYAFLDCSALESVIIPDSVTQIGAQAFNGCASLKSVTIPDSITEIGEETFVCCESLESVTIPDSVTKIGDMAFFDCSALKSVTISRNCTVGEGAFESGVQINYYD